MAKTRIAKNALNSQKAMRSVQLNNQNHNFVKDPNAGKERQKELLERVKAKQAKKVAKKNGGAE